MMKRRRLLNTGVLLLLLGGGGAIVNVAVAWGFVLSMASSDYSATMHEAEMPWLASVPPDWRSPVHHQFFRRCGSTEIIASGNWNKESWPTWQQQRIVQSGWPFRALFLHRNRIMMAQFNCGDPWEHPPKNWREGLSVPQWFPSTSKRRFNVVPAEFLWPGFAINTIFYAAMLWVVWFTSGMVRRTLRRRRGLCPACAYPVGTSPVCTECGKAVRKA